jgi:hypothetical protein
MLTLILAIGMNTASAQENTGNNGNAVAVALSSKALKALKSLEDACNYPLMRSDFARNVGVINSNEICLNGLPKLYSVLKKTGLTVVGTPIIGTDGIKRDAINNGKDQITISYFQFIKNSSMDRMRIVLHEYCAVAGLESENAYGYSNLILDGMPIYLRTEIDSLPKFGNTNKFGESSFKYDRFTLSSETDSNFYCILNGYKAAASSETAHWSRGFVKNVLGKCDKINSNDIYDIISHGFGYYDLDSNGNPTNFSETGVYKKDVLIEGVNFCRISMGEGREYYTSITCAR